MLTKSLPAHGLAGHRSVKMGHSTFHVRILHIYPAPNDVPVTGCDDFFRDDFFRLDYFALGRVILYSVSSSLHFLYYRVMFDMDVFTELNKRAMCDDPYT